MAQQDSRLNSMPCRFHVIEGLDADQPFARQRLFQTLRSPDVQTADTDESIPIARLFRRHSE
jgi:hypothetical protein